MLAFLCFLWYTFHMKNTAVTTENWPLIIRKKDTRIAELEALVKYYEEQLRLNKHRQFGTSSEKSEYDQLNLFNEAEITADSAVAEPDLIEIEKHYRKAKRTASDRLPEDLPVEIVEHELPSDEQICPECGGALHVMGRENRRELKLIPAKAVVVEHVRHIYSCRHCETHNEHVPVIKAPMPEPVIRGSFASPEAIAHIACQKFVMGLPLYRQEQDWNRNGIMLSRQTMSNWLIRATEDWLTPIYEQLRIKLLTRKVLHADESVLQVLHEPGKTAQSKSYMWLYRTSGDAEHPIVLYDYQPDRKASRPAEFLKTFRGYLHTDGYDAYHKLPEHIVVTGCLAHCRRKFDEALKSLPQKDREGSNALFGKQYCDKLFALERAFAELGPEERFEKRRERSTPLLDEFFTWAISLKATPKTGIGKAVYYALSQRQYLERYLLDGRLEISNNRAERSIKPFVMGRKAWLFANTPDGAKASAILYSIVETAKENGLNPYEYLIYIFKNAPNWDVSNDPDALTRLLPDSSMLPHTCRYPSPPAERTKYVWDEDEIG